MSTNMKYEPITEFSAERCEILAQVIERQPHTTLGNPNGFNMVRERHICGAPSCMAGFAADMLTMYDGSPIVSFLGCSVREGMELYYGNFPTASNPLGISTIEYLLRITPAEAAAALRALAAKRQEKP